MLKDLVVRELNEYRCINKKVIFDANIVIIGLEIVWQRLK